MPLKTVCMYALHYIQFLANILTSLSFYMLYIKNSEGQDSLPDYFLYCKVI